MEKVTNLDILKEFHARIAEGATLKEVIKAYGGGTIYIPSYKKTFRDEEVITLHTKGMHVRDIASEFDLSLRRVYEIIKEGKDAMNDAPDIPSKQQTT